MFESGRFDIYPRSLQRVMAMATGNSIYIATLLVNDPAKVDVRNQIRRVVGNLGRAGMAMLISPVEPKVKPLEYNSWNLISHAEFDGNLQDSFQNTSLHLSFTDFEMPVDVKGAHGNRDTEVFLLESVVSVHDRGQWIGDIDVLSLLNSETVNSTRKSAGEICAMRTFASCCHSPPERCYQNSANLARIISIDSWEEFLDLPMGSVIFRGHGNWLARLAAAAISVQKGLETVILPDDVCWKCYRLASEPDLVSKSSMLIS
jgi:hypothetical protein